MMFQRKRQDPQRPQRPQNGIITRFKVMFRRLLDSYRAHRQARHARHSARQAEAEGGTELSDLRRRRGSRSVHGTQQGVVAENQGSETNPEDTDVDGTHGQDRRGTTDQGSETNPEDTDVDGTHGQDRRGTADNNSLAEPPPAARSFI